MSDYTKNLTEQTSPAYGNVQYTFDAIGDTQGDAASPNLAWPRQDGLWRGHPESECYTDRMSG